MRKKRKKVNKKIDSDPDLERLLYHLSYEITHSFHLYINEMESTLTEVWHEYSQMTIEEIQDKITQSFEDLRTDFNMKANFTEKQMIDLLNPLKKLKKFKERPGSQINEEPKEMAEIINIQETDK